ncbi:hypothetical protein NC651_001264 [Populus alba x Populus x berolinensis]|nr:hypothetical protein NC651_001264 [Populus alba x Populus x berolinensis]
MGISMFSKFMNNKMTSPRRHVQLDEYVSSSQYSQFAFNDYETPVDRILLSDNPSSSNTTSAPQHTQGVGTLVCSHQNIDIQTTFSLSNNTVQTQTNEINATKLFDPPQFSTFISFHCNDVISNHESQGLFEQALNHQSIIGQASYQKKKKKAYVI